MRQHRSLLYVAFVFLAAVHALIACSQNAAHSTAGEIAAALDLITLEALEMHVRYLADDAREGREAGEAGYDDAANYVAEQLMTMRVEPAGVEGWYQPVVLRRYRIESDSATLTLHRDGNDTEFVYRDDFSMRADAVRESTSVRAEVVYVGYGVHAPMHGYSDYEGIDVRGKIVAMFRGAPDVIEGTERAYYASSRTKAEEAVSRGAIGFLGLRSRKSEERRSWEDAKKSIGKSAQMVWVNEAGQASRYFAEIRGSASINIETAEEVFGLSPLSFEQALDAAEAGEPASAALGVEITLAQRSTHSNLLSPNVIGMVRGTDPELANEYVVYTAHLDHVGVIDVDEEDTIHNGAYDNAMGVALMLETARAFAAAPARRSVLFIALTAEEKGLLGSDYFVNNPTVPVGSIVANINLDMPLFLYPVADLVAFGSQHSSLQGAVEAAAADEGFVFSPDPMPEENIFVRSDQFSFVRKGVPAVYLIPGFTSTDASIDGEALFRDHLKNHYHEPTDDMGRPFHWESALRFARAHTRIGYKIADERERPGWNEGNFFGEKYARPTED